MGTKTIIAAGLCFIAVAAQASPTTNSWVGGSSFWDEGPWTLGVPSITDGIDVIANGGSKIVTIDDVVSGSEPDELTISNLTVIGLAGATNTLNLANMNAGAEIPLNILNQLIIGNGAQLEISNSMLQAYNCAITNGATLVLAVGSNSSPIVVSNNLALAGSLNVADDGGITNAAYTLFTYGGTLSYGGLAIGSTPSNVTCVVSTNVIGQVVLNVTITPPASPLPFQIISIVRSTNDIILTWTTAAAGANSVQAVNGGTSGYNTNAFQTIWTTNVLTGTTNSYTDVGGATNVPSRFYRIYYPH
ncbi:MAG TPA: hypothetical protein VMP11_19045 [Verrucomicrobiae bacterium]|nr:hypothetical protein [Verrucomicrobiae bacterium]